MLAYNEWPEMLQLFFFWIISQKSYLFFVFKLGFTSKTFSYSLTYFWGFFLFLSENKTEAPKTPWIPRWNKAVLPPPPFFSLFWNQTGFRIFYNCQLLFGWQNQFCFHNLKIIPENWETWTTSPVKPFVNNSNWKRHLSLHQN